MTSAEKQTSINRQSSQRAGVTDFIIVDNFKKHSKTLNRVILLLKCRSVTQ